MKRRVADLEGAMLDAAVARAAGLVLDPEWIDVTTVDDLARGERRQVQGGPPVAPAFSTDWAHGGPIIERERITLCGEGDFWDAYVAGRLAGHVGATPLVAAMRAFVASKFGEEIDLP